MRDETRERSNFTESRHGALMANILREWAMAALTLLFVLLYSAALLGWFRPTPDERLVARLEPVIFLFIGYYFGRLPARQSERVLKDEIVRQTQKADAAQHAREQALQAAAELDEKVKNAQAALSNPGHGAPPGTASRGTPDAASNDELLRHSVATALHVLKP